MRPETLIKLRVFFPGHYNLFMQGFPFSWLGRRIPVDVEHLVVKRYQARVLSLIRDAGWVGEKLVGLSIVGV